MAPSLALNSLGRPSGAYVNLIESLTPRDLFSKGSSISYSWKTLAAATGGGLFKIIIGCSGTLMSVMLESEVHELSIRLLFLR